MTWYPKVTQRRAVVASLKSIAFRNPDQTAYAPRHVAQRKEPTVLDELWDPGPVIEPEIRGRYKAPLVMQPPGED